MIEIQGLRVVFSAGTELENLALNGIDLSIDKGEFISLIGSNGAGKSTLLNVLAGEIRPSAGRILIDGVDRSPESTWRRAGWVARVFQSPNDGVCPLLTIEENLALAARRGRGRGLDWALNQKRREGFRELLSQARMGLENRLGEQVSRLSGGQRQALSLLMSVQCDSSILLLDEHLAALDPGAARLISDMTLSLVEKQGLTTLMVTHSMRDAINFGHRLVMLHQGQVILDIRGGEKARLKPQTVVDRFLQLTRDGADEGSLLMDGLS